MCVCAYVRVCMRARVYVCMCVVCMCVCVCVCVCVMCVIFLNTYNQQKVSFDIFENQIILFCSFSQLLDNQLHTIDRGAFDDLVGMERL